MSCGIRRVAKLVRCGPYKLAFVLNRCLDRYDHPSENLQRAASPNPFPQLANQDIQSPHSLYSSLGSPQETTGLSDGNAPKLTVEFEPASSAARNSATSQSDDGSVASSTLIVDDNMLNRRVRTISLD